MLLHQKNSTFGFDTSRNRLYALATHQYSEVSLKIITSMLKLFTRSVYCILDLGSTLYYVNPDMAIHFGFDA